MKIARQIWKSFNHENQITLSVCTFYDLLFVSFTGQVLLYQALDYIAKNKLAQEI